jgi:hypothetical protein
MKPGFGSIQSVFNAVWTPQKLGDKILFWGKYSEISSGQMPNKVTGSTDFLTVSGSVGSETYQCPNTQDYIDADTDYIWFKTNLVQRNTTTAELVGYDFPRTIIKYDNISPYALREIIILKVGEVLTSNEENHLRDYANLSIWWSNVLSFHGILKGNRNLSQSLWEGGHIEPYNVLLTLISGGVKIDWSNIAGIGLETEVWGKSDSDSYSLLTTVAAGILTYSNTIAPKDLRYYKLRTKDGAFYSPYSTEVSIAMLGSEKVPDGILLTDTDGNGRANIVNASSVSTYSIVTGNGFPGRAQRAVVATGANYATIGIPGYTTSGKSYRLRFYHRGVGTTNNRVFNDTGGAVYAYLSGITGNAESIDVVFVASGNGGIQFVCFGGASNWNEVGNISLKEVLVP